MSSPAIIHDAATLAIAKLGAKPQTAADDTFIAGAIIDLQATGYPKSGLAWVNLAFTTASGQAGAKQTLTLKVEHGATSNLADAADYDSTTYEFTWAADGANSRIHNLPLQLASSKRYVRVSAKLVKSGTVTISAQSLATGIVFFPSYEIPNSAYAASGYGNGTEPTA